jgi:hypothetical protein
VEWWERQTERRRIRYCAEYKHKAELLPARHFSVFARVRSIAALFLLLFVGHA